MAEFSRVLMVVNPISGGKDKSDIVEEVEKQVSGRNLELEIYYTSGKWDKEALFSVIEEYDPQRIISVGGDGTIKLIAELLTDDSIPIGIFPAGSANGLAENLNLDRNNAELTRIALGEKFKLIDAILINDELCLHISDIGLNAALIKNYQEGNIRGKLGYLIQSIPTLIKSDFPFQFNIEVDGKEISRKAVLIAVANAKKYGTGSKINPNGRYDDGKFEILIFKEFNIPQILQTFRENVEIDEDFLEIISAVETRIYSQKNIPFQIDGEYRGDVKEVTARISPIKIKIAVP
ncbi:diacylglycerol kinase family protein [Salinimicrobium sp. MT39]|uniref:Diacylglycerol kinase family protein n=1 Tax=Salinimicrobium profundisediminis TaxID=2994553 RepID=A0A9X3CU88_9FLAO|nr:diacylglycerol kinase family protein [Salinimicrobium profundisediminis]MCX2836665.1 diacylglycerol kinase family protein [Salinimicrobium profundisediminis]